MAQKKPSKEKSGREKKPKMNGSKPKKEVKGKTKRPGPGREIRPHWDSETNTDPYGFDTISRK